MAVELPDRRHEDGNLHHVGIRVTVPGRELVASVYPGYDGPGGFGSVLLVTAYGLVDGAIFGLLTAWLYNSFVEKAGADVRR